MVTMTDILLKRIYEGARKRKAYRTLADELGIPRGTVSHYIHQLRLAKANIPLKRHKRNLGKPIGVADIPSLVKQWEGQAA